VNDLLSRLKSWARTIKRDVTALYLAARDPGTAWYVKLLALCIAGYALSPIDLIPDVIPILGLLDEAVLLPLAILGVMKLIPKEDFRRFRAQADALQEKPVSRTAGMVVVGIWIAVLALSVYAVQ
jgi:uncharacterized membrane protein YkvA (DUF1232 family)